MVLSNKELAKKQQQQIRQLRRGLRQGLSEQERQATICALYCWENLS
jgi:hypothetical protein